METNGVSSIRNRNSPSSERFLSLFSKSEPENPNGDSISTVVGDELEEDDVFWTGDFSESNRNQSKPTPPRSIPNRSHHPWRPENSGILAVLPEEGVKRTPGDSPVVYRKTLFPPSSSSSTSRMIPAVPKKPLEYSLSLPTGKFHYHSAPVNVPIRQKVRYTGEDVDDYDDDDKMDNDGEMLPPHEIVARGASQANMTFSVLEGVGRTLKGRDLRQVRNAVWRQTAGMRKHQKKGWARLKPDFTDFYDFARSIEIQRANSMWKQDLEMEDDTVEGVYPNQSGTNDISQLLAWMEFCTDGFF